MLNKNYRHDIDGLRSLAIMGVFFFHLQIFYPAWKGGFLGVDIFFVISGFIIFNLLKKVKKIKDVKNFIYRRARRLLPNLFLVCFLIFVIYIFFFPDYLLKEHKSHFLVSLTGISNLYYVFQFNNYFNNLNYLNPFLHIWSLGVEFQLYFFTLILIIFIKLLKINYYLIIILVIFFLSLFLSIYLSELRYLYFFTPLRIFEFFLGGIVSYSSIKINNYNQNAISFFSILIIFFSFFYIDKENNVPGHLALYPCLAISALLLCQRSYVNNFLQKKYFRYIGKLSYILYLVHWPIIIFFNFYTKITLYNVILIIFFCLIISSLIYHLFEINLRKKKYFNIFFFISLIIFFFLYIFSNQIQSLKKYKYNIFEKSYLTQWYERNRNDKLIHDAKLKKINAANIIVIGDSYADDIYLGLLNQSAYEKNKVETYISLIKFDAACYSVILKKNNISKNDFKEFLQNYFGFLFVDNCSIQKKYFDEALKKIDHLNLEYVIISNQWNKNTIEFIPDLISMLSSFFSSNKIIFMRNNVTFNKFEELLPYSASAEDLNQSLYINLDRNAEQMNELIQKKIKKEIKFFTYDLCFDLLRTCNIYDPNTLKLTHRDTSHYTLDYSKTLAIMLKKNFIEISNTLKTKN
jgi:peptidoglycan/LPS O-acetylase OafA/YrhL